LSNSPQISLDASQTSFKAAATSYY